MSYRITKFDPEHGTQLSIQDGQALEQECHGWGIDKWTEVSNTGPCFSIFNDESLVACAGLIQHWYGRFHGWVLIDKSLDRYGLLWMHRRIKRYMAKFQEDELYRRIETVVDISICQNMRWPSMLGFKQEGHLSKYDSQGRDYILFARVV